MNSLPTGPDLTSCDLTNKKKMECINKTLASTKQKVKSYWMTFGAYSWDFPFPVTTYLMFSMVNLKSALISNFSCSDTTVEYGIWSNFSLFAQAVFIDME